MRKKHNLKLTKSISVVYYGYVDLNFDIEHKIDLFPFSGIGLIKRWKEHVELLEGAEKLSANSKYKKNIQDKIEYFNKLIVEQETYNNAIYKKEALEKRQNTDEITPIVINAIENMLSLKDDVFDLLYKNNGTIHGCFGFSSHGFIKIEYKGKLYVFEKGLAPDARKIEDYDDDCTLGGFEK